MLNSELEIDIEHIHLSWEKPSDMRETTQPQKMVLLLILKEKLITQVRAPAR